MRVTTKMTFSALINRSLRTNHPSSSIRFRARRMFATALIFDTETTSMVDFSKPPSDPVQPDLVQLGMLLVDTNTWEAKSEMSLLVKLRDSVEIHPAAYATHGISAQDCQQYGVDPDTAALVYSNMYQNADIIVAHNLNFDSIVMETALHRASNTVTILSSKDDDDDDDDDDNNNNKKQLICTMKSTTDVLKLPGKFGKQYKWPSLAEAYNFVTDKELQGGHDALIDSNACRVVFEYLIKEGIVSLSDKEEGGLPTNNNAHELVAEENVDEKKKNTPTETTKEKKPPRGSINIQETTGGGFIVSGQTYLVRHSLRSHGGYWNWKTKSWNFSDSNVLPLIQRLLEMKQLEA
mmetsp:Transcript_27961/g.42635  ORF Transcript_27961/g.42635 Transcript_27961/m.42635 type:complete len:350 (+) Transcript_27961:105-1154(+)